MDSSILDIKHSPGIDGMNPIRPTRRHRLWILISLCSGEASALLLSPPPPLLLLWAALPLRFSDCVADRRPAYVSLLMDCTAWTCWRRRASSASQASSSADVLVASHPRTSVITSTPLFTTIWNNKRERLLFTRRELYSDLFLVGQMSSTWRSTSDSL